MTATARTRSSFPAELQGSRVAGASGSLGVFEAKFIGSVPCKESRGNEAVEAGLQRSEGPLAVKYHAERFALKEVKAGFGELPRELWP